ncbi:MAG: TfoX/Sxy family protein [Verrucomicrobia bacterium]|nr:TfoX/Sxy family protein [Verrucomicrobiota bacterium]
MAKPFPAFVDGLVDLLADFGEITVRRMFGAYAIYRDGLTFAIVDDDIAYFKVDAENRPDFERAGQRPFTITLKDGRTEAMGYWTVPDDALDSPTRLRPWAQLAWGAAQRAAEKKAAKGSRAPRKQAPPTGGSREGTKGAKARRRR